MTLYDIGKGLFKGYFKLFNRIEVEGLENVPVSKGVLLCSNHINNLDPPLVGVACPRQVHFMAKAELFDIPVLGAAVRNVGAFPVKRGMGDKQALRSGMEILSNEGVLGLFPEGTRSKTGKLGKGLSGAGFFAVRPGVLVVPCAITGSYKPFQTVKITFGNPMDLSLLKEEKGAAKKATEVIMNEIQELLDKEAQKDLK
ncbi:lysophospholipid acyltransferase family protein [Pseudalkalibacillus caeni]|uniref:1-acyl-sn-glycerol-3-phosphate acyltransferase n=1 Tax=Exobacillus caeni TaxID=2574798 RepID=A0A5R9F0I7_9BACL|nr:lysophospholipid acyltransferase family protein [Pseudalkalibacillus caeni]TLS35946.1 1-acyl-sn-glycerol-3-phosphate acyltransferase [Pseudalkalibacillus caeni]